MNPLNNNSLAGSTFRWLPALAACLISLLFAGSVGATSAHWADLSSVKGSLTEASLTDKHVMHDMDSTSKPCENRNCSQPIECEMPCEMGGSCTSSGVVCLSNLNAELQSFQTEKLPSTQPSALVSRLAESLFRPPIQ